MINKTNFEDIYIPDLDAVIVENNVLEEGDMIAIGWAVVEKKVSENSSEGKWPEYIAKWKADGRI